MCSSGRIPTMKLRLPLALPDVTVTLNLWIPFENTSSLETVEHDVVVLPIFACVSFASRVTRVDFLVCDHVSGSWASTRAAPLKSFCSAMTASIMSSTLFCLVAPLAPIRDQHMPLLITRQVVSANCRLTAALTAGGRLEKAGPESRPFRLNLSFLRSMSRCTPMTIPAFWGLQYCRCFPCWYRNPAVDSEKPISPRYFSSSFELEGVLFASITPQKLLIVWFAFREP
mmetsp:Transcript_4922/g.11809  ORF Transcript_4922/g.11809 Transcript_4922/m.11809 type:complete len:228 (-) Transcript_4922:6563-7246(-)